MQKSTEVRQTNREETVERELQQQLIERDTTEKRMVRETFMVLGVKFTRIIEKLFGVDNPDGQKLVVLVREDIDPESAERDVEDLGKQFDNILNALLKTSDIKDDRVRLVRQAAENSRKRWISIAAGRKNPNEELTKLLKFLVNSNDAELFEAAGTQSLMMCENLRNDSEREGDKATTAQEAQHAYQGVLAAAGPIAERRMVIDRALGRKTDEQVIRASSLGFVELLPDPLYREGSKAVVSRIAEIDAQLRAFDSKPDSERTQADEMNVNMLWEERKRHTSSLVLLEGFEQLQEKERQIAERITATAESFDKEKRGILNGLAERINERTKRISELNERIKVLDEFIKYWEESPVSKEAEKELIEKGGDTVKLLTELENLRAQEDELREAVSRLDFDPEKEIAPEQTALFKKLIDIASDGDGETIANAIESRLERTDIGNAERAVLERALAEIDKKPWTQQRENPLGIKIGDTVNIELGSGQLKFKHEVVGFTPDGHFIVRNEAGNTRVFDQELVVKLPKETALDTVGMSPDLNEQDKTLMREALEGPATQTEHLAAKEQKLEINDLRAIRDVFTSMRELLQAGGFNAELEELPKSWDEFLNADKNKGIVGWLKNRLGVKSEQQIMMDKISGVYNNRLGDLLNVQPPEVDEQSKERVEKAVERMRAVKPPTKFTMPGNL